MCGLVGVAGKLYVQEKKAFRNLLELDEHRGPHSTGIAAVHVDNGVNLYKALGRPWHIYEQYPDDFDKEDDTYKHYQVKALIGHNRFATVGKKTPENAHPFRHGDVVGAHNGTLDKTWLHKIDGHDKFEVDSEALIYSINKNGLDATLENTKGAWALTWFDAKKDRMNFIRNTERPLHWCFTQDKQNMYWSSEIWVLEMALAKAGVKHEKIQSMDPYQLHWVEFDKDGAIKGRKLYYDPKEHKGFVPPVKPVATYHNWKQSQGGGQKEGTGPFPKDGQAQNTEVKNTTNNTATGDGRPPNFDARKGSEAHDLIDQFTKALVGSVISFQTFGERKPKIGPDYVLCDAARVNDLYEIRIYSGFNKRHREWADSQKFFLGRVKSAVCNWDPIAGKWDRYITIDMRSISEGMDNIPTVEQIKEASELNRYERIVLAKPKEVDKSTNEATIIDLFKHQQQKGNEEPTIILGNNPLLKWDPKKEYIGYQGRTLTFSQFMSAVKSGCSECGIDPTPYEADNLVWVGTKQFICQLCDHRHRTEAALKKTQK